MRFKALSELKRTEAQEVVLATLTQEIRMDHYAKLKAFAINELVRSLHGGSFEWYGFTLGDRDHPELIIDIGLPWNDENLLQYTRISPERIALYQETLPAERVITGWIHSHGSMENQGFSILDEENHLTVLDFVTSLLRKPVAKKEVIIKDLTLLVAGCYREEDLAQGSVSFITDLPVHQVRVLETIYGGFCYSMVIGDDGWHQQEIYYKSKAILSGQVTVTHRKADLVLLDRGRSLTPAEIDLLREEIREKIRPTTYTPPKLETV